MSVLPSASKHSIVCSSGDSSIGIQAITLLPKKQSSRGLLLREIKRTDADDIDAEMLDFSTSDDDMTCKLRNNRTVSIWTKHVFRGKGVLSTFF